MWRAGYREFVVTAVLVMMGVSVGTAAAQDSPPRTVGVTGTFTASAVNVMQRICDGQDGPYLELRGRFAGVASSSDPRLTGDLEFVAEPALVNLATGLGTFQGRFWITDPATRVQTAAGEFHTVVTEGSLNHGFALGAVTGQGSGPSERFFAAFESTLDASLNVSGQFGGTGDPRTPAVVQGGRCGGGFAPAP